MATTMRLKSYFAGTVEAAMALARRELGEDAMLVQSRRASPEARYLGDYEVVFALAGPEGAPPKPAGEARPGAPPAASPPPENTAVERLASEIASLKNRLEQLSATLGEGRSGKAPGGVPASLHHVLSALIAAEVSPELAEEMVSAIAREDAPARQVLQRYVRVDPSLGVPGAERRIVALVGPPGCGKTTTLVKLAAQFALDPSKPAQILSMDLFRFAAAEQLRSYAAVLGIPCQCVESTFALAQAIEEHWQKHLILIDTPGLAERDLKTVEDLAVFLSHHSQIDTHLVLPASMRAADIARTADRYDRFGPRKLLFTRLDETRTIGPLLNESRRKTLPLSFLASGQQIPEDLEAAGAARIVELLLHAAAEKPRYPSSPAMGQGDAA
jgi:flagellar biosynthesis protein FlhF